jgi:pSer/pThr/pTyr-binding forkhead associated (FHA) protein
MEAKRRIEQGPGPSTARELRAVLQAARDRAPFLVYRDPAGAQRIVGFGSERTALTLGRNPTADLSIGWDDQVSALHAVIERLAGELTLRDDGLSRNGSYLNGERVHGIRRLRDGDVLRLGRALVLVRNPADAGRSATAAAFGPLRAVNLSAQQRKVLSVLCRPLTDTNELATLPTNQEIADELYLSVAAVKLHLRALFDKFAIAHLPQNKKRVVLAQRALQSGLLSDRDRIAHQTRHDAVS